MWPWEELAQGPQVPLMPTASCRHREARRSSCPRPRKTRQGVSTVVSEHRRQCAQCAGTREGPEPRRDWQRPAAPGARRGFPAPTPDKERPRAWGAARPSRHLGRLGALWRGLCLTPPLPPPARPAAAAREQEAGLEGVRDDDHPRKPEERRWRVHLGCKWLREMRAF